MMKKVSKSLMLIVLSLVMVLGLSLTGCGRGGADYDAYCEHGKLKTEGCYECGTACIHGVHIDAACPDCEREASYCEHGKPKLECEICTPPAPVSNVEFWGWGDATEVAVFKELVEQFNAENEGKIHVTYSNKGKGEYEQNTPIALAGRSGPDVFYVGDGDAKDWITRGYLRPLDEHIKTTSLDMEDIWDSALQRYRYDPRAVQSRPTDTLYALPKDIGPTVIYYNKNAMATVGVTEISAFPEDMVEWNAANHKDYPARGFFLIDNAGRVVTIEDMNVSVDTLKGMSSRVLNNRIPMTWEENVALSKLLTKSYNADSPTQYGYFTEWWFSYGWSVGGNCVKLVTDNNQSKWKFTLGDKTRMLNSEGQEMPSMFEAFTHFVSLSQGKDKDVDGLGTMGLAITPPPSAVTDKVGNFRSTNSSQNNVAMLVDGRWTTAALRKNQPSFDWDVMPLPKAKLGVEAGHSGSVGIAINQKSRVPNAAFKFIEFMAGPEGQAAQAATGFNIPNQKSVAATEVFLQSDKKPANAEIFLRAAEVQGPGDWAFLPDGLWIDEWAPVLNGDVRNGRTNLTEFFEIVQSRTDGALSRYETGR